MVVFDWCGYWFEIRERSAALLPEAGVYVFVKKIHDGWEPIYVGQTGDSSNPLPDRKLRRLAFQMGATHVHTKYVAQKDRRDAIEQALTRNLSLLPNRANQ
ncbi:hypothetical protein PAN31117_05102 [Pandoraea anapnoica]|uniref:GIY-YIG domain-containing protein n=1 Tax=Pandoraea anapnoica TaxID=2508301 RepID=A0A5E5AN29_9BURK|nr:hypothetical protein PIN31009_05298 [Pandoraea iniqua]VVE75181.1 hypothetical protein PAN31117_05102 [Pandoraea anapnoica]